MINLLYYDSFIKESYDSFNSRIKTWGGSSSHVHRVATKLGYFTNLFKNITPEDKDLIEWYRDGGYRQIAEFLYANVDTDEAEYPDGSIKSLKKCIMKLDEILNKSIIKKDVVLWKGLRTGWTPKLKGISLINNIKNMKMGDTYTFKNFLSTSLNFQYALFSFAYYQEKDKEIVMLKINATSGTKGAYISHDKTENEVLLQRGQTLKLKNSFEYNIGKHFPLHDRFIKIYEFDIV